jgi:ABC-type multidrug transport system fused ATPase/permease subunit
MVNRMDSSSYSEERKDIEKKLKLDSPEGIERALQYFGNLYRNEENRRDRIEGRANLLIASASIILTFVTGFLCMILYDMESISLAFLIIIFIIFIVVVAFIVDSIISSLEINKLGKYAMTDHDFVNYSISESDIIHIKKARVINYYMLFDKNKQINEEKEKYLYKSQRSIKNAVIILLLISIAFVVDLALSNKINIKYLHKIREFL